MSSVFVVGNDRNEPAAVGDDEMQHALEVYKIRSALRALNEFVESHLPPEHHLYLHISRGWCCDKPADDPVHKP